jgi:hypothetical protein
MKISIIAIAVFIATLASAQSNSSTSRGSPPWIVETFFTKTNFPDAEQYYFGEMKSYYLKTPPMGAYVPPGFKRKIEPLFISDSNQVYRFTYSESPAAGDWYAFLSKVDNMWKLTAVRTLVIPGFVRELRDGLQKKSVRTEKEKHELERMNLWFSTDAELKKYGIEKYSLLTKLANRILKGETNEALAAELTELKVDHANLLKQGYVQIIIGGILDNSVGFIFVPDHVSPPQMDAGDFILIEPIKDGWFLFKTT